MNKKKINLAFSFSILCFAVAANSIFGQTVVSLKIDKSEKAPFGGGLVKNDSSESGLFAREAEAIMKTPSGALVKIKRTNQNAAFEVWVDGNLNGRFDEKSIVLPNDSEIVVTVNHKTKNGATVKLPYVISHKRRERNGEIRDYFSWYSHYKAAGVWKTADCSADVFLQDFNADGAFDEKDAQATNFQIDRNADKKIWGKEEYARTNEIIEFCNQSFLISAMAADGSSLTLQPTNLKIAKVGEVVPEFSVTTVSLREISSESLKGKNYLLDFWASWCVPCVENLPQVKKLSAEFDDLIVISINVDASARKQIVEEIIKRNGLNEAVVIRGLGDYDPLWKMFGGANQNHLTIPLYVLVDKNGVVRYADKGGENLTELRGEIKTVLF